MQSHNMLPAPLTLTVISNELQWSLSLRWRTWVTDVSLGTEIYRSACWSVVIFCNEHIPLQRSFFDKGWEMYILSMCSYTLIKETSLCDRDNLRKLQTITTKPHSVETSFCGFGEIAILNAQWLLWFVKEGDGKIVKATRWDSLLWHCVS